jgi:hypothetical protein
MERLREWFGSPVTAGKTLVWLCWATFLVSVVVGVLIGLLALLVWGLQAVF